MTINVLDQLRADFSSVATVDYEALELELRSLQEKYNTLFICESEAGNKLSKRISEIRTLLKTKTDWARLDPSFYNQTTEHNGIVMPKFSFIGVNRTNTEIRLESNRIGPYLNPYVRCSHNQPNCVDSQVHNIMESNNEVVIKKSLWGLQGLLFCRKSILAVTVLSTLATGFLSSWGYSWIPAISIGLAYLINLAVMAFFYYIHDRKASIILTDEIGNMVIPDHIRESIVSYKNKFDRIWLLKEATWDVSIEVENEEEPSKLGERLDPDPILVGEKDNMLYVLDCFDLTPAEDYINREFAV